MWEYAAPIAVYTYNRLPSKAINLQIPFERFFGKRVSVENLVRLWCLIYTINHDPQWKKVGEKSSEKFMLCYTNIGYNVIDLKTNKIESVKHTCCVKGKVYGNDIKRKW